MSPDLPLAKQPILLSMALEPIGDVTQSPSSVSIIVVPSIPSMGQRGNWVLGVSHLWVMLVPSSHAERMNEIGSKDTNE